MSQGSEFPVKRGYTLMTRTCRMTTSRGSLECAYKELLQAAFKSELGRVVALLHLPAILIFAMLSQLSAGFEVRFRNTAYVPVY